MAALGRVETGRRRLGSSVPFLVAGAVVLALAGPAVQRREAQTFRNLDGVIFVIDVSGSMVRDESWPKLVNVARAGLSVLGSKPAALIVYGGDSYLASPLTTDHVQLGQAVSLLDEDTMPDRGNRPALALGRAADVLQAADILAGDVVLMTDGEGLDANALRAAQRIADIGGRLSVVVSRTTVSDAPPVGQATFDTFARVGGGKVYDTGDLEAVMADFGETSAARLERQDLQLLLLVDYGRYLLFLALLPALMFFRRERG
ncbi:vWA domain-containing protein [Hoeflea ulvae]|uniref:VWA domain-containing protein n=1 Tax=Hoeflea ulvae TaxID=2983764 RepID=A0ABT3YKT0_9HYPH|nr:VWA domain-containing protein [Hoeflea ulvae]MCY0096493.1 VWA domain-containing protein [Hoeflea ulvae]